MTHYTEEREEWAKELRDGSKDTHPLDLVFGDRKNHKTYCMLPSLDGVVEGGVGENEQESLADYLTKLEGLMLELKVKREAILRGSVELEYTNVGEI